ncbi:arabinogalactan endo-1,4-beta-galactosidase [Ligilactobacillus sp. WC1T17]|uniref:Arabinogalactan endo-beta-1,4-galactanase n=1 Tax=Ligilactobacillus ruminis TaxID=1623 RepID=A0ABY1ACI0_9LACO|nr:arabinogalactan endo-1,4-beta-galactosidase [Ligilactobacillus ruminis]
MLGKKGLLLGILALGLGTLGFGKTAWADAQTANQDLSQTVRVDKVDNLSSDFVMGADVSTMLAEEQSGVKYYDLDGSQKDLLAILKAHGINTIRVRIWNNPYDAAGHGYGAGNCTIKTALEIGKRATQLGLKVQPDFHYSDFWADPGRQVAPKAWQNHTLAQKVDDVYAFTKDCLTQLKEAGVNVSIVQIGNETNNALAGVNGDDRFSLLNAGCKAAREVDPKALVAVHFTDPATRALEFAQKLKEYRVDYDVYATSYYPCWHGSMTKLTEVLKTIANDYDKQVMVTETAYLFTLDEGDDDAGHANSVSKLSDLLADGAYYPATVQGQTHAIRDVISAVSQVGAKGLGVSYWEPAWIPVSNQGRTANNALWEKYGSGWASSSVIGYDPNVTAANYGGSQWENEALFDYQGHALASINVFKDVYTGKNTDLAEPMLPKPEVKKDIDSLLTDPSFEQEDKASSWVLDNDAISLQDDANNAKTGSHIASFGAGSDFKTGLSQTVTLLPGKYQLTMQAQGGTMTNGSSLTLYAVVDGQEISSQLPSLTVWKDWKEGKLQFTVTKEAPVKIGVKIIGNSGMWGKLDDFCLQKTNELNPKEVKAIKKAQRQSVKKARKEAKAKQKAQRKAEKQAQKQAKAKRKAQKQAENKNQL